MNIHGNKKLPIEVTEFVIEMDVNDEHSLKQKSPLEVTAFEIEMVVEDEHKKNKFYN
jgi:hypothetical protein